MTRRSIIAFAFLFCVLTIRFARADIVWDNGAPTVDGGALASDFRFHVQWADDFFLDAPQSISRVRWWGQYLPHDTPTIDQFTIRIFPDFAGSPAIKPIYETSVGNVGRVNSGPVSFGFNTYAYDAPIPAAMLGEGTYWLSIVNDTTLDGDDIWYWSRESRFFGNVNTRNNDGDAWEFNPFGGGSTTAFVLETPEPSAGCFAFAILVGGFRCRAGRSRW